MSPLISDAIKLGPLNPTEQKVLKVIESHGHSHIWSRKLNDLAELAAWAEFPEYPQVQNYIVLSNEEASTLTINSKLQVSRGEISQNTPTLRTIATALQKLAESERIWAGELYEKGATKTRYYGKKGDGLKNIERELENLGSVQKERAALETLSVEDLKKRSSDNIAESEGAET